ncbi:glutamine synthetase family protein [Streptomyces huiliensis]|uniref:glutamine synthetase family protein n=1 Tax=Streptomyces huiliensis TaxID=2876027 RepID=UPI001CBBBF77|nr:glutamine synthetase family protein [Streptomyces huiliensis]MBZ4318418.1 glutamine synthetase family protein [Streptomyces huiliensis]
MDALTPSNGRLTPDELREEVRRGRIDTVALALVDMQGRLKGKRYDAGHFVEKVVDGGSDLCAYALATDVDMRPLPGYALSSWDTGYGDLHLTPDPETVRVLPWWPGTALVHTNATLDGRPVAVAPRELLRRELGLLAERGLSARTGLETEFVLYEGSYELAAAGRAGLRPVTGRNRDLSLDHDDRTDTFLRALGSAMRGAGLPLEAAKTEAGPGQVEITFPYGEALTACDGHVLFKHAARHLGTRAGLAPSFMAVPAPGVGSGLHLHLSLWAGDEPVVPDAGGGLSATGRHAVAGLLTALPELAPLYAPNVNSYRRYVPESFAPTAFTWGHDNRTCAVRVVGRGKGLHLEIRLPGADANPYLALAAALAAIRHGLDHTLEPPPAVTGSAYGQDAPPVPAGLAEAVARFRAGALARKLLTDEVVDHYARAAEVELEALGAAAEADEVTDDEVRRWWEYA